MNDVTEIDLADPQHFWPAPEQVGWSLHSFLTKTGMDLTDPEHFVVAPLEEVGCNLYLHLIQVFLTNHVTGMDLTDPEHFGLALPEEVELQWFLMNDANYRLDWEKGHVLHLSVSMADLLTLQI